MQVRIGRAIKTIQKAGFSHIKVELEAQLFRNSAVREQNGTTYNFGSEIDCQRYLKQYLSPAALTAINYMKFYRDGSVDSEVTFTLPVSECQYVVEVIDAWNKLAEATGGRMEVHGAGMHIAVLTSGVYPTSERLPEDKLDNFKREVSKLLPALYIAGTSGNFTRGLRYRQAQIGTAKYSAISTRSNHCLEYRLFETCYQRPEAIFEYISTIAKTLEYYIDPSKRVTALDENFPIFEGKGLQGFTSTAEQITIIKKQFKFVKPDGLTIKQFMTDRGIDLTIGKIRKSQAGRVKKLKIAYKEHLRTIESIRKTPLNGYQQDGLEYYKREYPDQTDDWYREQVTGQKLIAMDESAYIKKNIEPMARPSVVIAT